MANIEQQIYGLLEVGKFIEEFLMKSPENYNEEDLRFFLLLKQSELENSWFTEDNVRFSLAQWSELFVDENINKWLFNYKISKTKKKVGLILAGNIPLVGLHDILSVVFSGHIPLIKMSSKDKVLLPFILEKWNVFSNGSITYELVDKLQNFDAVIATGSNNTARYLEYYFKNHKSIIRKNRTSVAVLTGDETDDELKLLAKDIFQYFGLGCRNVTRIFIPENIKLDRLFENFIDYGHIINHNSYANNYDYNKAIYLLNQEKFWDNNFVMLKEDDKLFSPLSVINFSRYSDLEQVNEFIIQNEDQIQCVVSSLNLLPMETVNFGEAQNPSLETYADNVDTMAFLETI